MKIRIRYAKAIDHGEEMELWVNLEDLFAVFDSLKASVMADYLTVRLKERVKKQEEGGAR